MEQFTAIADVAVSLKGSLARGQIDMYSDIDFELAHNSSTDADGLRARVRNIVPSAGELLAHFTAVHLGLENLLIFFLKVDDTVVKADVDIELVAAIERGTRVILSDPSNLLSNMANAGHYDDANQPASNVVLTDQRFCGWTWYAYAKLARGELFECASSLATIRELALVPTIQIAQSLPHEGYRHLDERLEAEDKERFLRTYPQDLSRSELLRCLMAMADYYSQLRTAVTATVAKDRLARLDEMIEIIRGDAQTRLRI